MPSFSSSLDGAFDTNPLSHGWYEYGLDGNISVLVSSAFGFSSLDNVAYPGTARLSEWYWGQIACRSSGIGRGNAALVLEGDLGINSGEYDNMKGFAVTYYAIQDAGDPLYVFDGGSFSTRKDANYQVGSGWQGASPSVGDWEAGVISGFVNVPFNNYGLTVYIYGIGSNAGSALNAYLDNVSLYVVTNSQYWYEAGPYNQDFTAGWSLWSGATAVMSLRPNTYLIDDMRAFFSSQNWMFMKVSTQTPQNVYQVVSVPNYWDAMYNAIDSGEIGFVYRYQYRLVGSQDTALVGVQFLSGSDTVLQSYSHVQSPFIGANVGESYTGSVAMPALTRKIRYDLWLNDEVAGTNANALVSGITGYCISNTDIDTLHIGYLPYSEGLFVTSYYNWSVDTGPDNNTTLGSAGIGLNSLSQAWPLPYYGGDHLKMWAWVGSAEYIRYKNLYTIPSSVSSPGNRVLRLHTRFNGDASDFFRPSIHILDATSKMIASEVRTLVLNDVDNPIDWYCEVEVPKESAMAQIVLDGKQLAGAFISKNIVDLTLEVRVNSAYRYPISPLNGDGSLGNSYWTARTGTLEAYTAASMNSCIMPIWPAMLWPNSAELASFYQDVAIPDSGYFHSAIDNGSLTFHYKYYASGQAENGVIGVEFLSGSDTVLQSYAHVQSPFQAQSHTYPYSGHVTVPSLSRTIRYNFESVRSAGAELNWQFTNLVGWFEYPTDLYPAAVSGGEFLWAAESFDGTFDSSSPILKWFPGASNMNILSNSAFGITSGQTFWYMDTAASQDTGGMFLQLPGSLGIWTGNRFIRLHYHATDADVDGDAGTVQPWVYAPLTSDYGQPCYHAFDDTLLSSSNLNDTWISTYVDVPLPDRAHTFALCTLFKRYAGTYNNFYTDTYCIALYTNTYCRYDMTPFNWGTEYGSVNSLSTWVINTGGTDDGAFTTLDYPYPDFLDGISIDSIPGPTDFGWIYNVQTLVDDQDGLVYSKIDEGGQTVEFGFFVKAYDPYVGTTSISNNIVGLQFLSGSDTVLSSMSITQSFDQATYASCGGFHTIAQTYTIPALTRRARIDWYAERDLADSNTAMGGFFINLITTSPLQVPVAQIELPDWNFANNSTGNWTANTGTPFVADSLQDCNNLYVQFNHPLCQISNESLDVARISQVTVINTAVRGGKNVLRMRYWQPNGNFRFAATVMGLVDANGKMNAAKSFGYINQTSWFTPQSIDLPLTHEDQDVWVSYQSNKTSGATHRGMIGETELYVITGTAYHYRCRPLNNDWTDGVSQWIVTSGGTYFILDINSLTETNQYFHVATRMVMGNSLWFTAYQDVTIVDTDGAVLTAIDNGSLEFRYDYLMGNDNSGDEGLVGIQFLSGSDTVLASHSNVASQFDPQIYSAWYSHVTTVPALTRKVRYDLWGRKTQVSTLEMFLGPIAGWLVSGTQLYDDGTGVSSVSSDGGGGSSSPAALSYFRTFPIDDNRDFPLTVNSIRDFPQR